MKTANDKLVEQACAGNTAPLLAKLKTGTVAFSGTQATSENDRGDPPADTLWYTVLNAHNDGELSDAAFEQCRQAMYAGHGMTA